MLTLGQTAAELLGDLEHARYAVEGRPEVHETHAQACAAIDGGWREKDAPVTLHLAGEPDVVRVDVAHAGWHMPEADGGEHRVVEELELGRVAQRFGEISGVGEGVFDPGAVLGGAVDAEGHPKSQGAEGSRVLEGAVYRVRDVALVQHVALLVAE